MRVAVPQPRALAALAAPLAVAGCGVQSQPGPGGSGGPASKAAVPKVTPRATSQGVVLAPDPEAKDSFPLPEGTRGAAKAPLPGEAPDAPTRKVPRSNAG